ncbi:MAG: hypothetical protein ACI4XB_02870, partial [Ruminococcus sp.]
FFEEGRTRPPLLVKPFQQVKPCKHPGGMFATNCKLTSLKTSHRDVFKILLYKTVYKGESGLVRFPLEKLSLFSPLFSVAQKDAPGCFAVCGRRQGALPLDPTSIF